MATDIKNTADDVDMGECDGEKVVTMMDVLKEQEDFEENANAVLGGSDDKNCTYSKGYIKRQALYACLTCCSDARTDPEKRAGVCLACSLNCHENHELIELYTKRNFRCDCGNPKFNSHPCAFTPNKTDLNEDNIYNQNFSGLYCTCKRPYPDPELTEEEEMIQCIVCEDWLHATHLESTVPPNDQYSEMICKSCMDKNEFLHDYSEFAVNPDFFVEVVNVNGTDKSNDSAAMNGDIKKVEFEKDPSKTNLDVEMTDEKQETPLYSTSETKDETISKSSDLDDELGKKGTTDTVTNLNDETELKQTSNITSDNTSCEDETTIDKNETENITTEKSKQDEEITSKVTDGENPNEVSEKDPVDTEKKIIEDEEKIEEDRLLADPDDNLKSDTKEVIIKNEEITKTEPISKNDGAKEGAEQQEKEPSTSESITENKLDEDSKNDSSQVKSDKDKSNTEEIDENSGSKEKISEKRKFSTDENKDIESKKVKLNDSSSCSRPRGVKRVLKGATFWQSNFRQKLCVCQECLSMYRDLAVLFLTDTEDTTTAYESLGKGVNGKPLNQYEKGLAALSSLDRVQQINALTEYNRMKDKLVDFLKSFKDRREIVKEEDIKAFFAGMKPKKQSDGVYFCR